MLLTTRTIRGRTDQRMTNGDSQAEHANARAPREQAPWLDLVKGRENELRHALAVIRRHKAVIFATIVVVTVGTLLVVLQLTPLYTASALIMLNTRSANVISVASVMAGLPPDANVIKSEIDVLESRALAGRVIADLQLASDPEFSPPPAGTGLLAVLNPLSWIPNEWRRVL